MSPLHYRTSVLRGLYAVAFSAGYMLLAAYRFSGDDGSANNSGVYRLLIGAAIACGAGALAGPALHRRLFNLGSPASSRARHKSGHSDRSKRR